jgi:hypothetical protein
MHEAVRDVEPASAVPRGQATRARTSPPIVGVPRTRRAPLPPPRRTDPREALLAAKAPAPSRARGPYLIVLAAFAAAGAIAVALSSPDAVGLPSRSAAPAGAATRLFVTAVDAAREARELRELARATAAAEAAALADAKEKNQAKKTGPAPSAPPSGAVEEPSSPGPGGTTGGNEEPTLLDDATALLEGSANELGGSAGQLLKETTKLLEDTTKPLLEEAGSLELDPSLP